MHGTIVPARVNTRSPPMSRDISFEGCRVQKKTTMSIPRSMKPQFTTKCSKYDRNNYYNLIKWPLEAVQGQETSLLRAEGSRKRLKWEFQAPWSHKLTLNGQNMTGRSIPLAENDPYKLSKVKKTLFWGLQGPEKHSKEYSKLHDAINCN
jgi:hypothetical protein